MVKMIMLDSNAPYRAVPPFIAPETPNNIKKGRAYIVLAPTVEEEFKYLSNPNCPIRFRNLYKYFIDKKIQISLYGQGRKIIEPNETGEITELLNHYKRNNLVKIDEVTSYLRTNKTRPLKEFNVLCEVNHLYEIIMDNPKDRRLISYKAEAYIKELSLLITELTGTESLIAPANKSYIMDMIIPTDMWFDQQMLNTPANLTKTATKVPMGKIIQLLFMNNAILERLGRIYLVHGNVIMPIDVKADNFKGLTTENRYNVLITLFHQFITKARNVKDAPDLTDENDIKAQKVAEQTAKDIIADKALETAKIDVDVVSDKDKEKIAAAAVKDPTVLDVDVPLPDTKVAAGDDVADIILSAKVSGKSVRSYKRDEELKKKYATLKLGDATLSELVEDEKQYDIPKQEIRANTVNKAMKEVAASNFDKTYNDNLADKDLANILIHFSKVIPALYLIKDVSVEDISSPTDRILRYKAVYEDENRKRHNLTFQLPKMYQDKYLYLNDQKMNLLHQKLPFPVTKVSPEKCQAVTNYKKIFSERYGANLSPRSTRLIKLLTSPNCPKAAVVSKGDATPINRPWMTTVEHDEISSQIVRLDIGTQKNYINIYFNLMDAYSIISSDLAPKIKDENSENLLPLAKQKAGTNTTYYFISGDSNKVYNDKGESQGELSVFISGLLLAFDPTCEEAFKGISTGSKFVYSRSTVMGEDVPMILMLSAADPGGLTTVLDKAGIEYQFVQRRADIPKDVDPDDRGIVQFEDGFLVYNRYPFENSLLLNGLSTFPSKEYTFFDMNTRDAYVEIFDDMFSRRNLVDALQNFYYMFIDPITMDVLIRLKMPTDFTRLMLYCNGVLADNSYQIDSDYNNSRLRSNEIIYAHLYRFLAEAWGNWRLGKLEKFTIREDAVIKELLKSNIVDPHSELNVMLETENDRQVKLKGPSGMNQDRSFTLEKRAYHQSMKGILGMNSAPSGEVGINRHLVLNPNIIDARGFMDIDDGTTDFDGSELATPAELMQVFAPEAADIERVMMSISQSKHVVPVEHSVACPISYDMERIMPYLSNDYAHVAKQDGEVVALENNIMIIKYKDGSIDDVDLSERPAKNTDGGFYIMNQKSTDLKVGSKIKKDQIVAYDKKYFSNKDMFGDPLAVMGTMARVAVETNGGVYEDACYITDELAHKMKTKITRQKRVILSRFANIKYIAKVGQYLKANDPLLIFDDTEDEFSSQILAQMAEEAEDEDDIIASSAPVVSKVSGTVKDIRVYYTIPLEQMTPSMKDIVNRYNKEANKREKTIQKYENLYDANTIVKTSEQLTPDSEGKVKGVRVNDGIFIDFYIEYEDIMAPGDKITMYDALKGVVSDIIPSGYEAYTASDPNHKIDAAVSAIGFYKRMCLDFSKVGGLCKISIEYKKRLKNKYLDKCRAALR